MGTPDPKEGHYGTHATGLQLLGLCHHDNRQLTHLELLTQPSQVQYQHFIVVVISYHSTISPFEHQITSNTQLHLLRLIYTRWSLMTVSGKCWHYAGKTPFMFLSVIFMKKKLYRCTYHLHHIFSRKTDQRDCVGVLWSTVECIISRVMQRSA